MSKREEFSTKTKDEAYARSNGRCENRKCGLPLHIGKIHYDHILPCGLGGRATLSNCQALCEPCHKEKTAREDVPRIRKADRQRKAHIGAAAPAGNIKSAPFATVDKQPKRDARKTSDIGLSNFARRFPQIEGDEA